MRLADEKVCSFEALLRWDHPDQTTRLPGQFLEHLEESGLITEVGDKVLETVGACLVQDQLPRCSVNVSAIQFRNGDMHEKISAFLTRLELPPERLILEVTESLLLEPDSVNRRQLHAINEMGVDLYLDDFGTGYSSLNYLRSFPVKALKIDRSYVRDIPEDRSDSVLVGTIIRMAMTWASRWWRKVSKPLNSGTFSGNWAATMCRAGCSDDRDPWGSDHLRKRRLSRLLVPDHSATSRTGNHGCARCPLACCAIQGQRNAGCASGRRHPVRNPLQTN